MTSILPPVLPLFGAAALFGLATVFRFSFYAGFVERPVSIALIWGLFTGEWALSLALGVFFELFWMDLIGGGTYLPPNANLPLLFCLFLSAAFSGQGVNIPEPPLVFIVLSIPLAFAGTALEQRQRQNQIAIHELFVEELQMDKAISTGLVLRSIAGLWLKSALLFVLVGVAGYWLFDLVISTHGAMPGPKKLDWAELWLTASLGGLLSLRTRRAVVSLGITLGIFCILLLRG